MKGVSDGGADAGFDRFAPLILAVIAGIIYLLLPRNGDILWMDASRHALSGAFVLDFVHAMPLGHPQEFALDYYRQWPALAILFYPPLFYVILALSYAVFGVSEATALIPELGFLFLLGWGAYVLSRQWVRGGPALGVAILLIGAPEIYFWGQQIMLDVPAYAFLMWSGVFFCRYLKTNKGLALYAAVICADCAIYTKYNAAFFVGVLGLTLIYAQGFRAVFRPVVLRAAALGVVLLVPLLLIFFKFAAYNLGQADAVTEEVAPRWSIAGWTFYAQIMPSVLSWPTVILAVAGGVWAAFDRRLRLPRTDAAFILLWLALGYIFYSMIAVKQPRHIMFVTYPIVFAAMLLVDRLPLRALFRSAAALLVAVVVLGISVATRPAPYVTGMREAAQEVAKVAPPETNVAFWGRLDGTFIYAMRAYANRTDLGVVRLDKLLLSDVAVEFDRGFKEKGLSSEQIVQNLKDLHVQYVVMQSGYMDDVGEIQRLDQALHSDQFTEVKRIKMTANYPFSYVTELTIYRAVEDVPQGRVAPPIEVKLLNKTL